MADLTSPLVSAISPDLAPPHLSPIGLAAGHPAKGAATDAKLRQTAKQFEAMFMTQMVHFARPQPKASGPFAAGDGEKTWGMFMDQALGTAAAAGLGPDLDHAIVKSLQIAQGKRNSGVK